LGSLKTDNTGVRNLAAVTKPRPLHSESQYWAF
jgi:hypothetical protein